MKILPQERLGYELGWLVSKMAGSKKKPLEDEPRGLMATFFVRAEYRLRNGVAPELCTEKPVIPSGDLPHEDPARGLAYPTDYVPHKPGGEFIVIGTAHHAGRGSDNKCGVSVRMGEYVKRIDVVGNRSWLPTLLRSKPGPAMGFDTIPLTYDRAWGDPTYAKNPLGCGRVGEAMHNLEIAGDWVETRWSKALPAGFGPIPSAWPQRHKRMGKYNSRWVRDHWPWLPPDFDYRFFMAAPDDQWIDGYFQGNEPIFLEQMHPEVPFYRTHLPDTRARCFVSQHIGERSAGSQSQPQGQPVFREVPLNLDTVWIDMNQEKMVLIWRGLLPVSSLKMLDVEHVLSLLEPLDGPDLSIEHYQGLLAEQLAPAVESPPFDAAAVRAQIDAAIAQGAKERADFEKMMAEKLAQTEAFVAAKTEQAVAEAKAAGMDLNIPDMTTGSNSSATPEAVIVELKKELATLEAFTDFDVSREKETVKQALAGMEEAAALIAGLPAELKAREEAILSQIPPEFLKVRKLPPGIPIDLEAARTVGFAKFDLAGVDFSGLDLSGVDFQGATLAGANFLKAKLMRANFSGANLTGALLTDADLRAATLDNADLTAALVSGTLWAGASLSKAKFSGLLLSGADFSGVSGLWADFSKAVLTESSFVNASLERADFTGANVERADFSNAKLERADFGGAHAAGIVMRGALLTNLRAREKADFTGAVANGAMADDSAWGTSTLDDADFQQATLRRAQFSEASLRGIRLDRCNLAHAVFDDANIESGLLSNANLLRATFDRANLTNACLDGSNLFEAGLWEATLEGATHQGANIKRTRFDR